MTKLTHREASYVPNGTPQAHCALCTMFRPLDECTAVEDIEWHGWCRLYTKKKD